jgi:hypothetical protein
MSTAVASTLWLPAIIVSLFVACLSVFISTWRGKKKWFLPGKKTNGRNSCTGAPTAINSKCQNLNSAELRSSGSGTSDSAERMSNLATTIGSLNLQTALPSILNNRRRSKRWKR